MREDRDISREVSRYHTIARTILLVDIPAAGFIVSCAIIGWPVAITMHQLFFWLGLILIGSLAVNGVAKLTVKNYESIRKDHSDTTMYIEQQRQNMLPPYPDDNYAIEESEDIQQVSQQAGTSGTLLSGVPMSHGVSQKSGDVLDNCNVAVARYLVDHPGASIREVERGTRYSRATIGRTNAWKDRAR